MTTLFVSDLHLEPSRPAVTALFVDFLQRRAGTADALYILGDLFEAWIGDDDDDPLGEQVAGALRRLSEAGTPVHFVHGNRDFLLGDDYARRSGMHLLPETRVIDLHGTPTLILHGDTLCTDDADYQAFRAKVRDPEWQRRILALPLEQRRAMASQLREDSRRATRLKPEDITDVNPQAVTAALRTHGVRHMIHGHTHRPAVHRLTVDGDEARRYVLGDWYEQGSVLAAGPGEWRLQALPLAGT
ncbi:MAG: UDP-2,3-diacylglucosamine diphosphatase [Candidatus Competibacterales bacterium]|nr:UDP-2,3-diacylglucosamine diphosphatase [Candidatus Competibacterales bacterium]